MPNRNHPPQPKPIQTLLHLPNPTQHHIKPNLPLFIFQDNTQQVLQLTFIAHKPPTHTRQETILHYFITKLLTEGTHTQNKTAIATHIDQYGASLHTQTTKDTIQLQLTTLPKHFPHLIPLFATLLTQPSFPKEPLQLEKQITQQDIQLREATPPLLAKAKLWEQTFGTHHPYGTIIQENDLPTITTETLQQTFAKHPWHNPSCTLSGHITPTIIQATQEALTNLPQTYTTQPTPKPTPSQKVLHIQTKNPIQTSIALGLPTIQRTHQNYPTLSIVNTLLGGYFGARLMQNIREDKGYTYGISSTLLPCLHHSFLYISSDIKKGLAQPTLQEITYEINKLQQEPVPQKELNDLKQFLNGKLLTTFDNIFSVAKHFNDLHLQGLDLTHYHHLHKTIQHITPTHIQHIAQKYLPTQHFTQVIVNE